MRKILSILVPACFIINMFGAWLLFGIYQHEAKVAMKSYIQLNPNQFQLVHFKITTQIASHFDIDECENEVSYNNVMYDIVAEKKMGETLFLYCIEDINETNLVDSYNNAIQKQHNQSHPKPTSTIFFTNQLYDDIQSAVVLNHPSVLMLASHIPFKQFYCNNVLHEVVSPPPQFNG